MRWIQAINRRLRLPRGTEDGIALFMVIASMSVLSIVVTEITYFAQMNQTLAFDALDQLKAHYLAKSGMKLSMLRLKAYQQAKSALASATAGAPGGAAAAGIPKSLIEKIWSFPFFFPIPTNIPGMTTLQKDSIEKFQKESGLEGQFSAIIEAESSKFNLNSVHSVFVAPSPSPSVSATPGASPSPSASPSPFSADTAREHLHDILQSTFNAKLETDADFAEEYRDFQFEDFMDNLFSFLDRLYTRKTAPLTDENLPRDKGGALTTISELRMVPMMDDKLYDLFAPVLTVAPTEGININTLKAETLKVLVPGIKEEEVTEFFKYRDSQEEDHLFTKEEDFIDYLSKNVPTFQKAFSPDSFKKDLEKKGIRLVVEDAHYKITVKSKVNQASRLFEAWVEVTEPDKASTAGAGAGGNNGAPNPNPNPAPVADAAGKRPDSGIRVYFMRIL